MLCRRGRPGGNRVRRGQPAALQRDSKRVAYVAAKGQARLVVADGLEGHEYLGIGANSLAFSPDGAQPDVCGGERRAAAGHLSTARPGRNMTPSARALRSSVPSASRTALYRAAGPKWVLVVDGRPGLDYDEFLKGHADLQFRRQAPGLCGAEGARVVRRRGRPAGPGYDEVAEGMVLFSPDGETPAYQVTKGRRGSWSWTGSREPSMTRSSKVPWSSARTASTRPISCGRPEVHRGRDGHETEQDGVFRGGAGLQPGRESAWRISCARARSGSSSPTASPARNCDEICRGSPSFLPDGTLVVPGRQERGSSTTSEQLPP